MRKRMLRRRSRSPHSLSVAVTASPATAGSTASLGICEDATFDFLAALYQSGTARAAADPTTRAEKDTEKYSGGTEVGQKTPGKPTAGVIDVYFHVISADGRHRGGQRRDHRRADHRAQPDVRAVGTAGTTRVSLPLAGVNRTERRVDDDRDNTIAGESR